MALKDLGEKRKEFYDGPEIAKEASKIIFPSVNLPLSIGGDFEVDDDVTVTLKGRVSEKSNTKWHKSITVEAKQGEVIKDGKDNKEKK